MEALDRVPTDSLANMVDHRAHLARGPFADMVSRRQQFEDLREARTTLLNRAAFIATDP